MDQSVGTGGGHQRLDKAGGHFGQFAVLEQLGRDEAFVAADVAQLFEHRNVGGVAGLCLFNDGQTEFFKQKLSDLLGGVKVDLRARAFAHGFRQLGDARVELGCQGCHLFAVQADTALFHRNEHRDERRVDAGEHRCHFLLFQLLSQRSAERKQA